jgi:hypothetical protein
MKIKEKFSAILPWYSEKDNSNKSNECIKIADDYAIEFAEWSVARAMGLDSFKLNNGELETFKKEKGL